MSAPRWPTTQQIVQVAAEEAVRIGVPLEQVLGPSKRRAPTEARTAAWRRIVAETGCSRLGLSIVWGCDRKSVQRALKVAA